MKNKPDYDIEKLTNTFLIHAIKAENEPNRYDLEFNLPRALHHMCLEINRLQNRVHDLEENKHGK